ncbi:hypothetical protein [Yimella sp. NH-Cas1]|uniref:hypothetical protein n=1 Tax=Yimella sp. NH-Cas1 TaxID=2917726 RepID=UPI001EFA5FCB|nr:hypothetical protein [Yimella sp. NH-Cas1]MCG8654246.1 hypothetical protein [Yimella sp. NH-Cas1]
MRAQPQRIDTFDECSDAVVYDIMRERLTRLGGSLIALIDREEARGAGLVRVGKLFARKDEYRHAVDAVDPGDRAAQIRMIAYLSTERGRG